MRVGHKLRFNLSSRALTRLRHCPDGGVIAQRESGVSAPILSWQTGSGPKANGRQGA